MEFDTDWHDAHVHDKKPSNIILRYSIEIEKTKCLFELLQIYMDCERLIGNNFIHECDRNKVIELQDRLIFSAAKIRSRNIRDVACKLMIWKMDCAEVDAEFATRGETLAVETVDELADISGMKQDRFSQQREFFSVSAPDQTTGSDRP